MMCYYVTQSFYMFPINFRMSNKKCPSRYFVQSFKTLAYGYELHTNRIQNSYTCWRHQKIISTMIIL